jgi:hypothetical protein
VGQHEVVYHLIYGFQISSLKSHSSSLQLFVSSNEDSETNDKINPGVGLEFDSSVYIVRLLRELAPRIGVFICNEPFRVDPKLRLASRVALPFQLNESKMKA